MAIRQFAYLNTQALDDYVASLEGGLRQSRVVTSERSGELSTGVNVKVLHGDGSKRSGSSDSTESLDTPPARFERLHQLAQESNELERIPHLDELKDAGYGALVEFESDTEIPQASRVLASGKELQQFANIAESLGPLAELFGDDLAEIPTANEVEQVRVGGAFLARMNVQPILVCSDESSTWKAAGVLRREFLRIALEDFEDYYVVVAKVQRPIPKGSYKPLLTFPGASILSRAERRAMEREKPQPGQEDQYVEGPLRLIDILAVYR